MPRQRSFAFSYPYSLEEYRKVKCSLIRSHAIQYAYAVQFQEQIHFLVQTRYGEDVLLKGLLLLPQNFEWSACTNVAHQLLELRGLISSGGTDVFEIGRAFEKVFPSNLNEREPAYVERKAEIRSGVQTKVNSDRFQFGELAEGDQDVFPNRLQKKQRVQAEKIEPQESNKALHMPEPESIEICLLSDSEEADNSMASAPNGDFNSGIVSGGIVVYSPFFSLSQAVKASIIKDGPTILIRFLDMMLNHQFADIPSFGDCIQDHSNLSGIPMTFLGLPMFQHCATNARLCTDHLVLCKGERWACAELVDALFSLCSATVIGATMSVVGESHRANPSKRSSRNEIAYMSRSEQGTQVVLSAFASKNLKGDGSLDSDINILKLIEDGADEFIFPLNIGSTREMSLSGGNHWSYFQVKIKNEFIWAMDPYGPRSPYTKELEWAALRLQRYIQTKTGKTYGWGFVEIPRDSRQNDGFNCGFHVVMHFLSLLHGDRFKYSLALVQALRKIAPLLLMSCSNEIRQLKMTDDVPRFSVRQLKGFDSFKRSIEASHLEASRDVSTGVSICNDAVVTTQTESSTGASSAVTDTYDILSTLTKGRLSIQADVKDAAAPTFVAKYTSENDIYQQHIMKMSRARRASGRQVRDSSSDEEH
mmetsp:Transcript_27059/g.71309  ORF Transcript_27059/g.71309 Transcript_27059/m.71309 type:complete len:647 (-) Transcript_27059:160-2100(-)